MVQAFTRRELSKEELRSRPSVEAMKDERQESKRKRRVRRGGGGEGKEEGEDFCWRVFTSRCTSLSLEESLSLLITTRNPMHQNKTHRQTHKDIYGETRKGPREERRCKSALSKRTNRLLLFLLLGFSCHDLFHLIACTGLFVCVASHFIQKEKGNRGVAGIQTHII